MSGLGRKPKSRPAQLPRDKLHNDSHVVTDECSDGGSGKTPQLNSSLMAKEETTITRLQRLCRWRWVRNEHRIDGQIVILCGKGW